MLPARKKRRSHGRIAAQPQRCPASRANRNWRRSVRVRSIPGLRRRCGSIIHPGPGTCQNAAGIPTRAQHQISRPEVEQGKVGWNRHAVGLQRSLGVGESANSICADRAAGNIGQHSIVSRAIGRLLARPATAVTRSKSKLAAPVISGVVTTMLPAPLVRPCRRTAGSKLQAWRAARQCSSGSRCFRSGEEGNRSIGCFSALNLHAAALRDHAGLPDLAQRILAVADFLVHVGQFEAAVAAALTPARTPYCA